MENGPDGPLSRTPVIEQGVHGPRNEEGFLLRAPPTEELIWDLDTEVSSARRAWVPERGAWWIASSYLDTVVSVVLRSHPSVLVLGLEEDRLLSRDGSNVLQGRLL
jgi:hypothetical protein